MQKREGCVLSPVAALPPLAAKAKATINNRTSIKLRDDSAGTLFFYLGSEVLEGSKLEVVLPVPRGDAEDVRWIRCQCRVVRVEEQRRDRKLGLGAVVEQYETVEPADLPRV